MLTENGNSDDALSRYPHAPFERAGSDPSSMNGNIFILSCQYAFLHFLSERFCQNPRMTLQTVAGTERVETLFSQKQIASLLGFSGRTLERHRQAGTGPRFVRLGRLIRYRERDVAEWIECGLLASTSERPGHLSGTMEPQHGRE